MSSLDLRRVDVASILDLRHRVLRAGMPREAASFPGDEVETTLHFAACDGHEPRCCLTLMRSTWDGQPAWQLRGMATDEGLRGTGVGSALVQFAEEAAHDAAPPMPIWCNARLKAMPFYLKHGFVLASEVFEIPDAGPHRRMVKGA